MQDFSEALTSYVLLPIVALVVTFNFCLSSNEPEKDLPWKPWDKKALRQVSDEE